MIRENNGSTTLERLIAKTMEKEDQDRNKVMLSTEKSKHFYIL